MGQHTWFVKSSKIEKELEALYEQLDKHENGEIYLDDLEEGIIAQKTSELYKQNSTDYHDCFRTTKRESNNTYCLDVISSKEECEKWLKDNKSTIYYLHQESLDKFWKEYPEGAIRFG